jgi:hypothetical protein
MTVQWWRHPEGTRWQNMLRRCYGRNHPARANDRIPHQQWR